MWYANFGVGNIEGVELSSKLHWKRLDLTLSENWKDYLIITGYNLI